MRCFTWPIRSPVHKLAKEVGATPGELRRAVQSKMNYGTKDSWRRARGFARAAILCGNTKFAKAIVLEVQSERY